MRIGSVFLFLLIVFLVIAAAVFGGWVGARWALGQQMQPALSAAGASTSVPANILTSAPTNKLIISQTEIQTTVTDVVAKIEPAVVTVVGSVSGNMSFFGMTTDQQVSGSGFIISASGYIITNNHVVENANSLYVIFNNSNELPARLVSRDAYSDLAVFKGRGHHAGRGKVGQLGFIKTR